MLVIAPLKIASPGARGKAANFTLDDPTLSARSHSSMSLPERGRLTASHHGRFFGDAQYLRDRDI